MSTKKQFSCVKMNLFFCLEHVRIEMGDELENGLDDMVGRKLGEYGVEYSMRTALLD